MRLLHIALSCMLAIGAGSAVHAQTYPSRPVTLVVNSIAGGPVDYIARAMQDTMAAELGQPIVIENRVGAVGVVGAASVARADPDGYTLILSGAGPMLLAPMTVPGITYVPLRDFIPVTLCIEAELVVAAHPSAGKTLPEFVEKAKKEPGKYSFASAGVAGPAHLAGEYLKKFAGIDIVHVPYKGSTLAVTDILAGRVAFYPSTVPPVIAQLTSGSLNALVVVGKERSKLLPDIKTSVEYGYPETWAPAWFGIFSPKDTPDPIVAKVNAAAQAALKTPKVQEAFRQGAYRTLALPPKEFRAFLEEEHVRWGKFIKEAKISVN